VFPYIRALFTDEARFVSLTRGLLGGLGAWLVQNPDAVAGLPHGIGPVLVAIALALNSSAATTGSQPAPPIAKMFRRGGIGIVVLGLLGLALPALADAPAPMTRTLNECQSTVLCTAQGVTGPCLTAKFTFEDQEVSAADDTITETAHGLATVAGPVQVTKSGGVFPAGIVATTDYWLIVVDANTVQLASSLADALDGDPLDLTDAGDNGVTYTVTGDKIVADLSGFRRATLYATGSTATPYACQLFSNRTGYHATARGQVTTVGLSQAAPVIHYDGPLDKVWAECTTVTGGLVIVGAEVCP
jgi:hypothetical protein